MTGCLFTLFKRKSSPFYYVRFKNEQTGKYFKTQYSTKKTAKQDALKVAMDWYVNGVNNNSSLSSISLIDLCKEKISSVEEAKAIIDIFIKKGLVKNAIYPNTEQAIFFTDYLLDFWTWEKSPYIKRRLKKEHSIHKDYVNNCFHYAKKYWLPYFKGKLIGEISKRDLDMFIDKQLTPLNFSPASKNMILKSGLRCLSFAFKEKIISENITQNIEGFSGKGKQRKILTKEIAASLFSSNWKNKTMFVANLLASVTGLRSGEIRALRRCDIGTDCLYIRHNWSRLEGLKLPKNNEIRTVAVPKPILLMLLDISNKNPHSCSKESFVFWSKNPNKPLSDVALINALRTALQTIGMTKSESSKYTFHSWRHFFASNMKNKISDKLLQAQTGHKSIKMLNHYSDHELPEDFVKIKKVQEAIFNDVIFFYSRRKKIEEKK